MVIFNEKFLPYLQLSVHIFGGQADQGGQAHVSWRLIAIYYGLCFLGVGSIIYQLFCPIEVKRFGAAADYIAAWRSHMGDVALGRIESRLAADDVSMKEFVSIRDLAQQRRLAASHEERERIDAKYWPDVLEMNFKYVNESRWLARILTFLCDSVGLIILSIPSIDAFYRVALVSVHSFFP